MVALALFCGIFRLQQSFHVYGLPRELAERYVMTAGISGIIGARVWYLFEFYPEIKHDLWGAAFGSAGFTFYGGFVFAALALFLRVKLDRLSLQKFMDAVGPALALGYAVGRLGCQLSGDGDYGIETTSIWGMSYGTGVVPTPPGVLVYPTPFFESLYSLGVLYVLTRIEGNSLHKRAFFPFGIYLCLMALERFLVEFIRVNPKVYSLFSEAQVVALILFLLGMVFLLSPGRRRNTDKSGAVGPLKFP